MLRYAAQQILLGQRSGHSEVMMGHVAEAVQLCHTSGHPAVAVGILQIIMPQGNQQFMICRFVERLKLALIDSNIQCI